MLPGMAEERVLVAWGVRERGRKERGRREELCRPTGQDQRKQEGTEPNS